MRSLRSISSPLISLWAAAFLAGCGLDDAAEPGRELDASGRLDAGAVEVGFVDAPAVADADARDESEDALDAEAADPWRLTGDCAIEPLLTRPGSAIVANEFTFGDDPYDEADLSRLSAGAQRIATTENAGGSSRLSEAFAFEFLARCGGATLLKTETEIEYDRDLPGAITDLLIDYGGERYGVSVVRAFTFTPDDSEPPPYEESRAVELLEKKLRKINESNERVVARDAWSRQILSVLADTAEHREVIERVAPRLSAELLGETVIVVTWTVGADDPIYE